MVVTLLKDDYTYIYIYDEKLLRRTFFGKRPFTDSVLSNMRSVLGVISNVVGGWFVLSKDSFSI